MLGDIGQPEFVGVVSGEVTLHEIIVDRQPGALPVLAALLAEHGPPLIVPADPPRGPLAPLFTGLAGFADQEPIPELGIIAVGIQ